jgi:hypothetical protein
MNKDIHIIFEKYILSENRKDNLSILGKLQNEIDSKTKSISGLSRKDLEELLTNLDNNIGWGTPHFKEDYNKFAEVIKLILISEGLPENIIKNINIHEIVLNLRDRQGNEMDNSIQGFEDPNGVYSPGEITLFKIDKITQAYDNGVIEHFYYYPHGAGFWDANF